MDHKKVAQGATYLSILQPIPQVCPQDVFRRVLNLSEEIRRVGFRYLVEIFQKVA